MIRFLKICLRLGTKISKMYSPVLFQSSNLCLTKIYIVHFVDVCGTQIKPPLAPEKCILFKYCEINSTS